MKLYTFYTIIHRNDGSHVSRQDWQTYAKDEKEAEQISKTYLRQ